jgi:hypothetical protein
VGTGIAALVARLRELKDQGWDFDAAWKRALEDCPVDTRREFAIRERLRGVCRDAWMTLFDVTIRRCWRRRCVDWLRGVCRDAWMDAPSVLGGPSRMRLLTDPSVLAPALAGSPARRAA